MRVFSSRQVGRMIGADPSSVNRWIDSGKLKAYRTPGGHRRILQGDLIPFLEALGVPLPAELEPARLRLLVVDADPRFLRSLRRALARGDSAPEVVVCGSIVEALIALGTFRPEVALLDVSMPALDAVEVCREIKRNPETREVRLIASAVRASAGLEERLGAVGVEALLVKPFKPAKLAEVIQRLRASPRF
jgi:excisionase family DNA binding protein